MALWYMQTKNNALNSLLCLVFLPKRCFCRLWSHNSLSTQLSVFHIIRLRRVFLCMTSHAGSSLGCQLQSRTVSNGKQRTLTSTCSRVLYNEMKQNSHWYFPSPENPKEKDHKFLFYFLFWFIIWDVYLIYKVSSIWSNSNLSIPPPNFHFLSKKKIVFD